MVQIDLEWPILAILQLFQYFATEVFWIDLEWLILAALQLFQYFPTEVVQIDSEWPIWPFGIFSNLFPPKCYENVELPQKYSEHIIFTLNVNFQEISLHVNHGVLF